MKISHRKRMPAEKLRFAKHLRKTQSPPELILWSRLRRRQLGVTIRRQEPMFGWIADFYCASAALIIEVDGKHHAFQKPQDARRDLAIAGKGIATIRFTAAEVFRDPAAVVARIASEIEHRPRR